MTPLARDTIRDTIGENVLVGAPRHTRHVDAEAYVVVAAARADLAAYHRLRRDVFVDEQGLFSGSDADDVDDDPRLRVLVARAPDGEILGGVRVHPALPPTADGRDLGWWRGSRLVVAPDARLHLGVGAALVRAACATAESAGALRFDATVQAQHEGLFARLGWLGRERVDLHGHPHVVVDWPIARVQRLADATKSALGGLLAGFQQLPYGGGGPDFLGDDGAPVPGTDVVAACDAILPAMVERDPEWAGWCAALVNLNDLSAMGAAPVGMLDAVGARDASFARRILRGLAEASHAWGVPVLGGHTQLGVPAALSVTALGRTERPVPGGGGRPGQALRVTADLGGGWRPGYHGAQWDSSSHRTGAELRALAGVVPSLHPTAAKDVSMSGLVGTTGMLAEASGCRAVLDVAAIPAPTHATAGDWLTCFPGFAMVTAEASEASGPDTALPGFVTSRTCGHLASGTGVGLRWPDGVVTEAIASPVTGLGPAGRLAGSMHPEGISSLTAPATPSGPLPGTASVAAVGGSFGRDVEENLAHIAAYVDDARARGVSLLALPEACLGGYLSVLGSGRDGTHAEEPEDLPPVMDLGGPELRRVAELAREMTLVVGFCEADGDQRYNSAAAVSGDGVIGVHRKVHQPLGEAMYYAAGDVFAAVDTPAGRLGMLICYDKAFPEAARALALDGADIIACISAWPASRTASAGDLAEDRWTHRFNIFDQARALENQVVWVASNQTGTFGKLRFVGNAKVVGPGGDVLATTGVGEGLAVAPIDVGESLEAARRSMFHLRDRRPDLYVERELEALRA